MVLTVAALVLALTRSEFIERMKAPVVTQTEGLVQVYADCPEDMRREYQSPVAGFVSETARALYRSLGMKPVRFRRAGIVVHLGDVRTNLSEVVTKVATNGDAVVTRLYLPSPGYADLRKFRIEAVKGFFRAVRGEEIDDAEAVARFRRSDPGFRVADEREALDRWLRFGEGDDEEGLRMMRKVIEPGFASPGDIVTFASRLFLYPPQYDITFADGSHSMSLRAAMHHADDPRIRFLALAKAEELVIFGGGRGERLSEAAADYRDYLRELAKGELNANELANLLESAETKLNIAYEEARKRAEGARR